MTVVVAVPLSADPARAVAAVNPIAVAAAEVGGFAGEGCRVKALR